MKLLLLVGFLASTTFAWNQIQHCGTDEMHKSLFQEHPEFNPGIIRAHESLNAFTNEFIQHIPKSGATYIIPVVFHIIHQNGSENISDLQVQDAVKQVNIQYRKLNADTSEIVSSFQTIAADAHIEIRLAQKDPNGNCTSGITRTVSPFSVVGDHQVKSLIHWPPEKYLNIYVCIGAAGLAGHALLPSAADTIPQWDGIVMQHSYIGTIGTSDFFRRTVLSHEIGHFLNLQHIWGGNNVPNYTYLPVGQAGNCTSSDEVADTPNSIGWTTCNLSANSCGQLENVQNYMDYAYCARMFTQGQVARMHACLNDTIANRFNLWQISNLIATGTDGSNNLCAANWNVSRRVACVGDAVTFTDVSYHGNHSRTWNFYGGTAQILTDSVAQVVYSTPGFYNVTLLVSDGANSPQKTETDYIYISPVISPTTAINEPFQNAAPNFVWEQTGESIGDWNTAATGFESSQSFCAPHFSASEALNYELISDPLNVDALFSLAIAYDWAYRKSKSTDSETFNIYVSANCGEFWQLRKTYGPSQIASVLTPDSSNFIPLNDLDWKHDTIFVNSAVTLNTHLLVKFEFVGLSGNNFYIDNIRVGEVNSLSLNKLDKSGISIYPNPVIDQLKINSEEEILAIKVFDDLGREIPFEMQTNFEQTSLNFISITETSCILKVVTATNLYTIRVLLQQK